MRAKWVQASGHLHPVTSARHPPESQKKVNSCHLPSVGVYAKQRLILLKMKITLRGVGEDRGA